MPEQYFVAYQTDDGVRIDGPLTREHLLNRISPDEEDGSTTYTAGQPVFLDAIPEYDGACWMRTHENALLIVKGEIVVPKPVQRVTKYEV